MYILGVDIPLIEIILAILLIAIILMIVLIIIILKARRLASQPSKYELEMLRRKSEELRKTTGSLKQVLQEESAESERLKSRTKFLRENLRQQMRASEQLKSSLKEAKKPIEARVVMTPKTKKIWFVPGKTTEIPIRSEERIQIERPKQKRFLGLFPVSSSASKAIKTRAKHAAEKRKADMHVAVEKARKEMITARKRSKAAKKAAAEREMKKKFDERKKMSKRFLRSIFGSKKK